MKKLIFLLLLFSCKKETAEPVKQETIFIQVDAVSQDGQVSSSDIITVK